MSKWVFQALFRETTALNYSFLRYEKIDVALLLSEIVSFSFLNVSTGGFPPEGQINWAEKNYIKIVYVGYM